MAIYDIREQYTYLVIGYQRNVSCIQGHMIAAEALFIVAAWMEQRIIRDVLAMNDISPDCVSLHPVYVTKGS